MIIDAHTHLFSHWYYASIVWQAREGATLADDDLREALQPLGLELPPADPQEHARRWLEQMDAHGVQRMILFSSLPGEQATVADAVAADPARLAGFTMVNPIAEGFMQPLQRDLAELKLSGIELFPAMHRFDPSDAALNGVYELAAEHEVPVFCHVGLLRVPLREKLGLPCPFDMRYSDPMLLHRAAADFPSVNFIMPHLGCGYLREAALLAAACPNVYIDTSSSNTWLNYTPERLTFERALEICLETFGPRRILFGTDSGTLPRGYRNDLLDRTRNALQSLNLSPDDQANILGHNAARLLNWPTA